MSLFPDTSAPTVRALAAVLRAGSVSVEMYQYDQADFFQGKEFRLEIYDAREPGKAHRILRLDEKSKQLQQIRSDFRDVLLDQ